MRSLASSLNSVSSTRTEPVTDEVRRLQSRVSRAERLADDQGLLIEMLAELLASTTLEQGLDALASVLKQQFGCERVAIALYSGEYLSLRTVSQQGVLGASTAEARLLVDAMGEACDQEKSITWPAQADDNHILAAHRALAGRRVKSAYCSVPMFTDQRVIGAFLLERREGSEFPVAKLEQLSVGLAPLVALHIKADRPWHQSLCESVKTKLERYFGYRHPGRRLAVLVAMVLAVASITIPTHWEVVAPAELLSTDRRVLSAPFDGFIASVEVEAGDSVDRDQLLIRLDARQLELERANRDSEITMAESEFRAAIASQDRQSTGIARARLAQARARHEAVLQRLSRSEVRSPIKGTVIAADTEHTAGAAVPRGEVLFEVAPNTGFDIHVLVDEADIYDVAVGQTGSLALRALPGEKLPLEVVSIQPVSEARDGHNRFRVKARLAQADERLRPGQSGVVRLQAGSTHLLGRLTRKLNRRVAEVWWRWIG